ncbi:hypothetical protein [Burkholderia ubonensis]|uniref:hypothetical protein n=1 Tax=Burkholderia ubonensis TaxID=101571 RepID=UPI0007599706|nr:hypothetical protein [Burkholderia ubonensis]KVN37657.1 hypothetical protein WJ64_05280 [Burkholderia ubonensis]
MKKSWRHRGFLIQVKLRAITAILVEGGTDEYIGYSALVELARPTTPDFEILTFEVGAEEHKPFTSETDAFWEGYIAAVRYVDEASPERDDEKPLANTQNRYHIG